MPKTQVPHYIQLPFSSASQILSWLNPKIQLLIMIFMDFPYSNAKKIGDLSFSPCFLHGFFAQFCPTNSTRRCSTKAPSEHHGTGEAVGDATAGPSKLLGTAHLGTDAGTQQYTVSTFGCFCFFFNIKYIKYMNMYIYILYYIYIYMYVYIYTCIHRLIYSNIF